MYNLVEVKHMEKDKIIQNDIKKIDTNMADSKMQEASTIFYDAFCGSFVIHGLYWASENKNFHRLPDTLETRDNLKALAAHPSGAYLSFRTDSSSISVKVKNQSASYMAHMSACGQCGLDLYVKVNDELVFLSTTKINKAEFQITMVKDMDKSMKEFRLYLPIYVALIELEVGLDSNSRLERSEEKRDKTIIWYGTSISQGGCATRGAMSSSAILERLLKDYEVYNFGFSGNAHLDIEVAHTLAEIKNVEYIIIESESNNTYARTKEKLYDFLKVLKDSNPNALMYVLSHYPNPYELVNSTFHKNQLKQKSLHKRIVKKLNDPKVIYIDGEKVIKEDKYEVTVDGIHQTDLGFMDVAKYFYKIIRKNAH